MKIVISDPKSGRSKGIEIAADAAATLVGRRIGESIEGSAFGLGGYKLKVTGGSDASGFPLNRSIQGTGKVKIMKLLAESGKRKGQYKRETARGGIIAQDTAQVNLSITEYGEKPIDEVMPPKGGKKAEGEAAPAPKEG
ncbi:MAG: 30S ribosomal protein S6e [Candidatus Micrarchaeota archaeon]|nr:30S ribosomal protein S6e [Candidatus Micrarchaeota archaeon]